MNLDPGSQFGLGRPARKFACQGRGAGFPWASLLLVLICGCSPASRSVTDSASARLLDPSRVENRAPETFRAVLTTTKGEVRVEMVREWSPLGVDRFYSLIEAGYFADVAFFRVVKGFVVQFGMHGDPVVNSVWQDATIPDEPVLQANRRGLLTYAKSNAPNSRSNQFFINLADNTQLDQMGFSPIGRVIDGMDVLDQLYSGYGDGPPMGRGPNQSRIQNEGNRYLKAEFPSLDYLLEARVLGE